MDSIAYLPYRVRRQTVTQILRLVYTHSVCLVAVSCECCKTMSTGPFHRLDWSLHLSYRAVETFFFHSPSITFCLVPKDNPDLTKSTPMICDLCDQDDLEVRTCVGSMRNQIQICPECDLPDGWVEKMSKKRKKRYYFHVASKMVQWGHPNPHSHLHISGDKGEASQKRRRIAVLVARDAQIAPPSLTDLPPELAPGLVRCQKSCFGPHQTSQENEYV
jgi:hypothetical protein